VPARNAGPEIQASPIEVGDLLPDRALTPRDRDEFDYEPIADRIADLCCVAEAPVNIALFSPWGSGKSSLFTLINRRLSERSGAVSLIRYDAWRYGGDALPRNFIAHAARELHLPLDDPRYSELHRGLYENQRRVSLSGPRLWSALRHGRLVPLILFAILLALLGWLLKIDSVLLGAVISTFLLILTALIDAGKVEVEQSKPSEDEEFSSRFGRLVDWATDGRTAPDGGRRKARAWRRARFRDIAYTLGLYRVALWWADELPAQPVPHAPSDRLVFFIDELDRCEAADIVKTLKALRTFLDAERCTFIVAADRQVIEEALSEVEQSTPIDPDRTYYSTAGAYLDKIFQHQISLPPLRSRSLAKYARRLTIDGGGLWKELVDLDPESDVATPTLDLVLFTLVPSHVRSPRRIKVLLNNYATNVRMVRSRLPDVWPDRAREIARLTAFQTEFPDFAADLSLEPRLPRFLLHPEDRPGSDNVTHALRRWDLGSGIGVTAQDDGDDTALDNPDPFLPAVEGGPDSAAAQVPQLAERRERLKQRRRDELRRYLERTDDVEDLRRDLFYLQPAGLDVGLEDPELAELIEVEATDSPETVVEALRGRGEDDLAGAGRLLAALVGDVLGPEQKQVMTALMEAVTLLGDGANRISLEVAGALRTYWSGNGELAEDQLVGALRTAVTVRLSSPELVPKVLGDDRLWANPDYVAAVIPMINQLHDGELEKLRSAIARHMPEEAGPLLKSVAYLSSAQKLRLMDSGAIFAAFGEAIDRADAEAEAEE
jgi:hypothetical protein